MGNYQGCMNGSPAEEECPPPVRIIVEEDDGHHHVVELREVGMKVGEVMLDYPSRCVCVCQSSMMSSEKILALPADHDLQPGHFYIMLPMPNLRRGLSQAQLDFLLPLLHQANNSNRKKTKERSEDYNAMMGKVVSLVSSTPSLLSSSSSLLSSNDEDVVRSQLLGKPKSWMPKLETISESTMLKC